MNSPKYMRYLGALCVVIALFGCAILAIGYRPPSFGRVATIVALFLIAAIAFYVSKRKR